MRRALLLGFILLVANSGYLAAFAEASLFYTANVLSHVALGVVLLALALSLLRALPREKAWLLTALVLAGAGAGPDAVWLQAASGRATRPVSHKPRIAVFIEGTSCSGWDGLNKSQACSELEHFGLRLG